LGTPVGLGTFPYDYFRQWLEEETGNQDGQTAQKEFPRIARIMKGEIRDFLEHPVR